MDMKTECAVRDRIAVLGSEAEEEEAFLLSFADRLCASLKNGDGIAEEFIYYMERKDFRCLTKVEGYTVVDIMVWQIDHFKAQLDRGNYGMKNNGSKMVLRAFDTMLKMKEDPEKYKQLMESETGTDYPGKY